MSKQYSLIETYSQGSKTLRQEVAGMSPEQMRARPIAGKWSTLEVVCHLVDSEQAWIHRLKRVIAEPRPLLIGFDENSFAATLGYQERNLEQELSQLELMRQQMTRILRSLPPEAWKRTGVHNERGLMGLEEMVQTITDHIPHHLAFVRQKRRALGLSANGH
jgi:uncharacterized damage-inducible protein DinB